MAARDFRYQPNKRPVLTGSQLAAQQIFFPPKAAFAQARTGTEITPGHPAQLESWMRSYRAEELFDSAGAHGREPARQRRELLRDLELPDFRDYAVPVGQPGAEMAEATRMLGARLRDVIKANMSNFRLRLKPGGDAADATATPGSRPQP